MQSNSFADKIRLKTDKEKEKLLKMQKDYENGIIKEEDMTPEQVLKIENLYIEQISKLRNDFNEYKHKTVSLRKKVIK